MVAGSLHFTKLCVAVLRRRARDGKEIVAMIDNMSEESNWQKKVREALRAKLQMNDVKYPCCAGYLKDCWDLVKIGKAIKIFSHGSYDSQFHNV